MAAPGTKSDVSKLQKELRAKTAPTGQVSGALGQRVGKVTATAVTTRPTG